jgi:hypothetical protein
VVTRRGLVLWGVCLLPGPLLLQSGSGPRSSMTGTARTKSLVEFMPGSQYGPPTLPGMVARGPAGSGGSQSSSLSRESPVVGRLPLLFPECHDNRVETLNASHFEHRFSRWGLEDLTTSHDDHWCLQWRCVTADRHIRTRHHFIGPHLMEMTISGAPSLAGTATTKRCSSDRWRGALHPASRGGPLIWGRFPRFRRQGVPWN